MNYDFMKGRTSKIKPLGRPVQMHEQPGKPSPVDEKQLIEAFNRGYNGALEVKGLLSRDEVLDLLESEDYATKHGKTIAKALREEWGIE